MIKKVVWLALLALAILAGCKKPDSSIGLENLPDSDFLTLVVDTLTVELNTVRDDSLRTDQFSNGILGRVFHPRLGEVSASFAAQLRLSATNSDFGTNPVADSVYLSLRYSGSAYGEYSDHRISVRQLKDSLSLDSIYYASFDPETLHGSLNDPYPAPISIKPTGYVITETDTSSAELRVDLNLDFAQTLLELDSLIYSSNDDWLEYFPGITVSSISGHGASGFDLSSGLSVVRVHYHNDDDTTHFDYLIGPTSARVNMFNSTYVPALDQINAVDPDSAVISGENLAYVMSGGGLLTTVEFPNLDIINTQLSIETAILKAELILPIDDGYYDARYAAPDVLGIGLRDDDGSLKAIPDKYSPIGVGGSYDRNLKEYRFNVTKTVQHILNRNFDYAGYGDFPPGEEVPPIIVTSLFPGTSIEGIVLRGTDVNENRARLVLTCSH